MELFDIIVDFPDTQNAVDDLKVLPPLIFDALHLHFR